MASLLIKSMKFCFEYTRKIYNNDIIKWDAISTTFTLNFTVSSKQTKNVTFNFKKLYNYMEQSK